MWILIILLTTVSPNNNVKAMSVTTQAVKSEKVCKTIVAEVERLARTVSDYDDVRYSCIKEEVRKAPARNVL